MSKVKKVILCCLSIPLIIISMCPTFAYAASRTLTFNCPEPSYGSNNSYIALGYNSDYGRVLCFNAYPISRENEKIPLDITVTLQSIKYNSSTGRKELSFVVASNALTDYFLNFYIIHSNGTVTYQPIYVIENALYNGVYSWTVSSSSEELYGLTFKGNVMIDGDNFPNIPLLNPIWSDNNQYYSQLQSIIDNLITLHSDNIDLVNKFVEAINNLSTLHADNVEQLGKLVEIINGVIQLHSDNLEILDEFATLLSDTAYIREVLDLIINYLTVDQTYLLWELDYELIDVNEKLDLIIQILQSSGESNLTSPDSSNVDDYYEIEQGLINRTDVDVSNVVNVQIDQNAMSFTWNLLDTIMNSNGKVFGMTLTVLSLGIIALILGR